MHVGSNGQKLNRKRDMFVAGGVLDERRFAARGKAESTDRSFVVSAAEVTATEWL